MDFKRKVDSKMEEIQLKRGDTYDQSRDGVVEDDILEVYIVGKSLHYAR